MDDSRWATIAPPDHLDSCCVSDVLDAKHQSAFATAVKNLLHAEITEQTFAQIIDGLPLKHVAYGLQHLGYPCRHLVFEHFELCPGVVEKARVFRDGINSRALRLRADILQRFQKVPTESRLSRFPLIELVAVALHTIVADLFETEETFHDRRCVYTSFRVGDELIHKPNPWPTTFAVHSYADKERFPRGVADVAGYWAEDQIFGGVVLFGRGETGTGYDGVWFQSHRKGVTNRIYALTEEQIESLLHFLEWEPKPQPKQQGQRPECPLPILGNDNNLTRVEPDVAIPMHNVFRDRWEKKASWESYDAYSMGSVKGRPRDELNYPEVKKGRVHIRHSDRAERPRMTFGEFMSRRKNGEGSDSGSGT